MDVGERVNLEEANSTVSRAHGELGILYVLTSMSGKLILQGEGAYLSNMQKEQSIDPEMPLMVF